MSDAIRSETLRCPACGASGQALLANGLCARCLLGAALGPDDDGTETPREVGRYRLIGAIARGGAGVVYRAWQPDLRRTVALKMLLPSRLGTKDARDRFRREAEVMASLDHPGILPVYEVGVDGEQPWFSMKLAEGGNLAEHVERLRGDFRASARLVADIARAVAHAHARGVLHRDLKPSNIVFDAAGQPLVTDFGLARFIAEDSTLTGADALIGTPRYAAPETVAMPGARVTAAADVYGLGAILYELLGGRAPFAELDTLQILREIATRRPRAPRQLDASIPPELEAICLRCLEKRTEDRYASASALADALDAWIAGAKPRRRLPGFSALKLDLPSRRRRIALGAMLALAVALTAAVVWYRSREPIPIPDPAIATQTIAVLPNLIVDDASEREIGRGLVGALAPQLPANLHILPFDTGFERAMAGPSFADIDIDTRTGAYLEIDVARAPVAGRFAVVVLDELREEILFETTLTAETLPRAAKEIAAALTAKRATPTAEARLSRHALTLLVRAIRQVDDKDDDKSLDAIEWMKEVVEEAPDSAMAHARLALALSGHGGEAYWLDSAIEEAARAQRMDPTLGMAAKHLGLMYMAKGWWVRMTAALEQARSLGSANIEDSLGWGYFTTGRFADSYRMTVERRRFGTDEMHPFMLAAQSAYAVGETDAGERMMRDLIDRDPDTSQRTVREAEIAFYRGDYARCRELVQTLDEDRSDAYFSSANLERICAIEQHDLPAALAAMEKTKRLFYRDGGRNAPNGNPPELREAILLTELGRGDGVPALIEKARTSLQAKIDSGDEYAPVWLRMASLQRLAGETDAAYATLEHAFAVGYTINFRTRKDIELMPFRGDARFAQFVARSDEHLADERGKFEEMFAAEARDAASNVPAAGANGTP
ncbi:MAG TPA: protein kinase [Rhodanobacteraceae bacterium]|nr:protein kinase [Rhodanobacteraceae bacterium]